ncbi:oxidoreductase [Rouxiella chamberiensis]|uniref:Oxidoreductase n=1 Tax=Rouxiella chamberiensis TaxID=1513468 RepID=A0ABY7HR68_9GAMM|nr:oxidoreductase [Rouxiella chamberiensis]WAT01321.1 oxidoreductase [Rouxiella chamberiensis]
MSHSASSESSIKVGIIGYGFSGKNIHSRLLAATPGLEVKTVCDKHASLQEDSPFTRVDNVDAVFDDPDIELVVIAMPNLTHFPLAKAALLAGKNVVVDKPFTVTAAEAEELAALAIRQQRILCPFQNRRYDNNFLTVRKLLEEKALGEVRYFESSYTLFQPGVNAGWREKKTQGSGVWFDLGAHLIDQMVQLFGEPQQSVVTFDTQREGASSPDFFHGTFVYPSLRVVLHGTLLSAWEPPRFRINGTEGSFVKYGQDPQEAALVAGIEPGSPGWGHDELPGTLYRREGDKVIETTYHGVDGNYPAFYLQLRDALRGIGEPPVKVEQALTTMRIIENTPRL